MTHATSTEDARIRRMLEESQVYMQEVDGGVRGLTVALLVAFTSVVSFFAGWVVGVTW